MVKEQSEHVLVLGFASRSQFPQKPRSWRQLWIPQWRRSSGPCTQSSAMLPLLPEQLIIKPDHKIGMSRLLTSEREHFRLSL